MHSKLETIKGKLRTIELLLADVAADYASDALILPTGELATTRDEATKNYLLAKADVILMGKAFIVDFRERL